MYLARFPLGAEADQFRDLQMPRLANQLIDTFEDIESLEILIEDSEVSPAKMWHMENSAPAP